MSVLATIWGWIVYQLGIRLLPLVSGSSSR